MLFFSIQVIALIAFTLYSTRTALARRPRRRGTRQRSGPTTWIGPASVTRSDDRCTTAASKARAERARADEERLMQLQAELAARESAESRRKSEPEAEASRPKLSFGFKPKASR